MHGCNNCCNFVHVHCSFPCSKVTLTMYNQFDFFNLFQTHNFCILVLAVNFTDIYVCVCVNCIWFNSIVIWLMIFLASDKLNFGNNIFFMNTHLKRIELFLIFCSCLIIRCLIYFQLIYSNSCVCSHYLLLHMHVCISIILL
jgi:hypothetical protein